MNQLKASLDEVRQRIHNAILKYNRQLGDVNLIAVSKNHSEKDILELYNLGVRDFGENYIQEWELKRVNLPQDINWHIIGNIQSNKTLAVAKSANWVHSIDKLKTARRLSMQRGSAVELLNICLEVNISQNPKRHGVLYSEVLNLAKELVHLPNLNFRGLMCIASATDSSIINIQMYEIHELYLYLNKLGFNLDTLSMGMSADLELAIANGSTHVRIGTDLFGSR